MKKIIYILALFINVAAFAQQSPSFSLYKFNMNIFNPAYAGASGTEVNLNFKTAGVEDGPSSQAGSASTNLGSNLGLGISVVNDNLFVKSETAATVDVSYKLQVADQTNLYLGVKAGANFVSVDFTDIITTDPNDPLFGANQSVTNPMFGAGLLLKGERYFVTASIPNFIGGDQYKLDGSNDVNLEGSEDLVTYLGAGMDFDLGTSFVLKPSVFTKFESGNTSVDLIAGFEYNKLVEAGVVYRLDELFAGYAVVNIKDFAAVGFSYNSVIGDFQDFDNGSFEFLVKLKF